MTDKPDRITVQDAVDAGFCITGLREWFKARAADLPSGMDLMEFARNGASVEDARALNDGQLNRILAAKEARRGK